MPPWAVPERCSLNALKRPKAYDDLGTEAIRRLRVENLPVIVVIDSEGTNLYATAADQWKK